MLLDYRRLILFISLCASFYTYKPLEKEVRQGINGGDADVVNDKIRSTAFDDVDKGRGKELGRIETV